MTIGWSAINQIADYVIITVGIAVLRGIRDGTVGRYSPLRSLR